MTVRKCAFREGLRSCKPPEVFQFYKVTKFYKKGGEKGGKRKINSLAEKKELLLRLSGSYDKSILIITGCFIVVISHWLSRDKPLWFHFTSLTCCCLVCNLAASLIRG